MTLVYLVYIALSWHQCPYHWNNGINLTNTASSPFEIYYKMIYWSFVSYSYLILKIQFKSAKDLILNICNKKDFFQPVKYIYDLVHELRREFLLRSLKNKKLFGFHKYV